MRLFGRFSRPIDGGIRLVVPAVFVAALLISCGGDETVPTQVKPPEPEVVPSGTFAITSVEIFETCDQPNIYNCDMVITVDGADFVMGDWTGTWDATTDNARGQSKIERTRNHRGCAITNWSTVDLTFTSADEFWGNISYRQRITEDGECGEPCNVTWGITGVRK